MGDDFASQVIAEKSTVHIANIPDSHIDIGEKLRLVNESFIEYYGVPLISNVLIPDVGSAASSVEGIIGVTQLLKNSRWIINNGHIWQKIL
ncbi:MAG: hypothetical protein KJ779_12710 [Firmicutes bacterium]|nr:hypothetical protein [Bacillota bacterium]